MIILDLFDDFVFEVLNAEFIAGDGEADAARFGSELEGVADEVD